MSLGPNGLVMFPLPVLQGSGHSGKILTYPQALGWDGEDKRKPRMFMLGFLEPGKNICRVFWSCFTFLWERESRASQMLGKHSTIELYF